MCALLEEGSKRRIDCWGDNQNGMLGQGHSNPISGIVTVDLGTAAPLQSVAAGQGHTCALFDDPDENRAVKCWGNGRTGALGLGDPKNRGDQPGQMGDALPFVKISGP